MDFTPKLDCVRTLIVESTDVSKPFDFDVDFFLSPTENTPRYCYIKLKNVLVQELDASNNAEDSRNRFFYVKGNLGQRVYNTSNKSRDFLGSFTVQKNSKPASIHNIFYQHHDNPLLEIPSIPHGRYNFKVVNDNDTVVDGTLANGSIKATKCVLIFELYYCR